MSECLTNPSDALLKQVAEGDRQALNRLIAQHRDYVHRIVDMRLESPLRSRVDPSDIVQESLAVASRRIDDFLDRRPTSFRVWLHRLVLQQLVDTRRRHYAQKRDVSLEFPLGNQSAARIVDSIFGERASEIVRKKELFEKVESAIQALPEVDREILSLRHTEGLPNSEVAEILDMKPSAVSNRHGRAILKLSDSLSPFEW